MMQALINGKSKLKFDRYENSVLSPSGKNKKEINSPQKAGMYYQARRANILRNYVGKI